MPEQEEFKGGDAFFKQMLDAGVATPEMIQEIVVTFLEESNESLISIAEASKKGNWDQVRRTAHKMKPGFLMFDLLSQHEIACSIERTPQIDRITISPILDTLFESCKRDFQLLREKYNLVSGE